MKRNKVSPFNNIDSKSPIEKLFSNEKVITFFILVFLVLLFFPVTKNYSKRMVTEKEIQEMRQAIAEFEKTNKDLIESLDYFNSIEAAEERGRVSFNLKKDGEGVIAIERSKELSVDSKELTSTSSISNLKLWYRYFFN